MRTLEALGDLHSRTVLVRADLNVPLDGQRIVDDGRIRASLETIQTLRQGGARVVVMSHLGRPNGTRDLAFSLEPVAARLEELLGTNVGFVPETIGEAAERAVSEVVDGDV